MELRINRVRINCSRPVVIIAETPCNKLSATLKSLDFGDGTAGVRDFVQSDHKNAFQ